jgi:hypothetical protein
LIPSDLDLFHTLKQELKSIQVVDYDEPFDFLQEILADIDQKELNRVLRT